MRNLKLSNKGQEIQDAYTKYVENSNDRTFNVLYKIIKIYLFEVFYQHNDLMIEAINTTLIKLHTKIHLYDPTKSNFITWIHQVNRIEYLQQIKKSRKKKEYSYDVDYNSTDGTHWKDTFSEGIELLEIEKDSPTTQELLKEIEDFVELMDLKMSKIWLYHYRHNWDYKYTYAHFDSYTKKGIRAAVNKVNEKIRAVPEFREALLSMAEDGII